MSEMVFHWDIQTQSLRELKSKYNAQQNVLDKI